LDQGFGFNNGFKGSGGAESFYGYGGEDTVGYLNSTSGVYVNLETNRGYYGDAQGDRYYSIENIVGSNHNDSLYGDDGDNMLSGADGNDNISPGGGADEVLGGDGIDSVNYGGSTSGVSVYLNTGRGYGGDAHLDTYDSIENVYGSAHRDVIIGNADDNQLFGNPGDDYISGADGDDYINGGSGDDDMRGGDGRDDLYGWTGDDSLDGGRGADELNGAQGRDTLRLMNDSLYQTENAWGDDNRFGDYADTFVILSSDIAGSSRAGRIVIQDFDHLDTIDLRSIPGLDSYWEMTVTDIGGGRRFQFEDELDLYVFTEGTSVGFSDFLI
jgi:Ca2+-binding RTX toxin-like protein